MACFEINFSLNEKKYFFSFYSTPFDHSISASVSTLATFLTHVAIKKTKLILNYFYVMG